MENNTRKPWETDVAVLCIFFARPEVFEKTFAAVKAARPRVLLLWQDGPRNEKDMENIQKCREIAEDIDWECEIHRNYHTENMGCDPSTFLSHKWAFSIVDKCIILEDDQVPGSSYFRYCKELLERYENDTRISHICGYNILGEAEHCPNDYLFALKGSGVWASWRRVAEGWDDTYSFLQDRYAMNNLRKKLGKKTFDRLYKNSSEHASQKKAFWETILGFDCLLNNRYVIIPKKNLATNIGITGDSTHSFAEYELLTKKQQKIFHNSIREMEFPMKHPKYVVPDYQYIKETDIILGNNTPIRNLFRKISYACKCIVHGKMGLLLAGVKRKISRVKRKVK